MKYGRLTAAEAPWLLGHRGASGDYPENTLPAFAAALEEGADGVELDIQLTCDEKLAVIHDDTLERTTDGTGPVNQKTLAHLQQLDAGSWFDRQFRDIKIPELGEVLDRLATAKVINVEIKPKKDPVLRHQTEDRLAELLDGRDIANLVVSAFDHRSLLRLRDLCPKLSLAALYNEIPTDRETDTLLKQLPQLAAFHLNAHKLHDNHFRLPQELEAAGIPILVWTLDNPEQMQQFIAQGISGFFTNHPKRLMKVKAADS